MFVSHSDFWDFIKFLETKENITYRCADRRARPLHVDRDAYVYKVDLVGPRARVCLIRSATTCPLFPVAHYRATHLMNFVSKDRVVVAYPTLTFARKGIVVNVHGQSEIDSTFEDLSSTITPSPFVSTPIFKQLVTSCGSSGGSVAPFSVVRLNAKLRRTSYSVACVSFVHVSTNVINRCPRGMKGVGCRYHCYSCVAPREIGRGAPAHSHQVPISQIGL